MALSQEALLQYGEMFDGFGVGVTFATGEHMDGLEVGAAPGHHHEPAQIASALFRVNCRLDYSGIGPYPQDIMDRLLH